MEYPNYNILYYVSLVLGIPRVKLVQGEFTIVRWPVKLYSMTFCLVMLYYYVKLLLFWYKHFYPFHGLFFILIVWNSTSIAVGNLVRCAWMLRKHRKHLKFCKITQSIDVILNADKSHDSKATNNFVISILLWCGFRLVFIYFSYAFFPNVRNGFFYQITSLNSEVCILHCCQDLLTVTSKMKFMNRRLVTIFETEDENEMPNTQDFGSICKKPLCNKLQEMSNLNFSYTRVIRCVDLMNDIYGLLVLCAMYLSFIGTFTLTAGIFMERSAIKMVGSTMYSLWLIILIWSVAIITLMADYMEGHRSELLSTVNKVALTKFENKEILNQVLKLRNQMMRRPLLLTAYGFFQVNGVLLHAFVATIISYIVIIYQMFIW